MPRSESEASGFQEGRNSAYKLPVRYLPTDRYSYLMRQQALLMPKVKNLSRMRLRSLWKTGWSSSLPTVFQRSKMQTGFWLLNRGKSPTQVRRVSLPEEREYTPNFYAIKLRGIRNFLKSTNCSRDFRLCY